MSARIEQYYIDETYRIYIADVLWAPAQNKRIEKRYYELTNQPIEERSGDEIAAEVIANAGLKLT